MGTCDLNWVAKRHYQRLILGWGLWSTWKNRPGSLKQLVKIIRNWDYPNCATYFIFSQEEIALYIEIEKKRKIDPNFDTACKGRFLFELLAWYADRIAYGSYK